MLVTEEIRAGVVLADRYRVRGRLGRGGMATVFLAEDCVLCRDVAIKRLHSARSDTHARRFRREARIGASLMHPNLVTIFDTLSAREGLLIIMEYVRGSALSDLIAPDGMAPARVLDVLRPVGLALDYAHANGVVHRDVKPANILIGDGGRVKLVDLGTATAANLGQITTESEVVGTLTYIAPERLAGESVGEAASDVYSLAVVAFEALTGRKPYHAETPAELLAAVEEGPPDPVELPQPVAAALAQGMDPDPHRRHPSAASLVSDLDSALAASPATAKLPPEPTEPTAPPIPSAPEPRAHGMALDLPDLEPDAPVGHPRVAPHEATRHTRLGILVALAFCAVLAAGVWIAVSSGGDSGGGRTTAHGKGAPASRTATSGQTSGGTTRSTAGGGASGGTSQPVVPAAAPGDGAQLNDQGYALIQQGRYSQAIPILRRAVTSFPPGTTDLTYAYALFNLGHALRMAGHPQAAIPILERRLRIPDQTATVQVELAAARAAAGR